MNDERVFGLDMCRDLYLNRMKRIDLEKLIDSYDKISRQIYNRVKRGLNSKISAVKDIPNKPRNRIPLYEPLDR